MKMIPSFLLLFAAVYLIQAQSDFRSGCIIISSQDTIFSQVDYRWDIRNIKVCSFIPEGQTTEEEYYPGYIYGYRYSDIPYLAYYRI